MSLFQGLLLVAGGIILIIVFTSWFRFNSFLSLFLVSLLMALIVLPLPQIVPALKKGFGDTMSSIGLIIIFGAAIGVALDVSGATVSIANFIMDRIGHKNPASAMALTGFIAGIPIFCDSGFIVLSGLNRSLTLKGKLNPVFMSSVLACSLYSVHCLIPPHPGITAAAGIFEANIGQLVIMGLIVAIPAALTGYFWSLFMTRRAKPSASPVKKSENTETSANNLPSFIRSILPIMVPLILITAGSLVLFFFDSHSTLIKTIIFAGDPVIALMIGMFLAFILLPVTNKDSINRVLTSAIEKAGPIIIITAAGGIFGAIIRQTGTGQQVGEFLSKTNLGLFVPFALAFILKTAQGSSTVAVITSASIMAPMTDIMGFSGTTDSLLVLLSMGAGSMMVSHANDSYFWVIANFSEIDPSDTLRVYSTSTIVMGITAFAAVMILSVFI